jgi:pyruvate kinase
MKKIIKRVERHHRETLTEFALTTLEESNDQTTAVAAATSILAHQLKAEMIVASTTSGATAVRVASYRPPIPIAAITDNVTTYRQMALVWGIKSFFVQNVKENEEGLNAVLKQMKNKGYVKDGDKLVFVTGQQPGVIGGSNIIKVEHV